MVKFIATRGDRKVLGIGLSLENIRRLQKNMPIHFNKEELGLPEIKIDEVVILYGLTEDHIREKLALSITEETIIKENKSRKPF